MQTMKMLCEVPKPARRTPVRAGSGLTGAVLAAALVAGALLAGAVAAQEWPGWRGPGRDGRLEGFSAPTSWPAKLDQLWQLEVGEGHASPVVGEGRAYAFTRRGDQETVTAVSLTDGKVAWQKSYPVAYEMNPAATAHGKGPKSTPVLAGGRLYTFGITGILSAWDAAKGDLVWRKELGGRFKHTSPDFGTATSPIVEGSLVIVHAGGSDSGALLAFDAASGKEVWSRPEEGPGYATPVMARWFGVPQLVTQMQASVAGVALADGALLWKIPFETEYVQNIVTPLVVGDILVYSGIDKGVIAVRPVRVEGGWLVKPVWKNDEVSLYMSSPVLASSPGGAGGRVCGLSHKRKGQLFCLDAASGKTLWANEGRMAENAAVYAAGDLLLVATDGGELVVARAGGGSYSEVARYPVATSATWASPAVFDRRLLVKDRTTLTLWALPG